MSAAEPLDPERLAAIKDRLYVTGWTGDGERVNDLDALLVDVQRLREQEQRIRALHSGEHMCVDSFGARVYFTGSMICATGRVLDICDCEIGEAQR